MGQQVSVGSMLGHQVSVGSTSAVARSRVATALVMLLAAATAIAGQKADPTRRAGSVELTTNKLRVGGTEIDADHGRLWVPENRARADSRLIELAFVHLKSLANDPDPPIVYLAGGPGSSSTWQAGESAYLGKYAAIL